MATAPFLVLVDGEPKLDAALGREGRFRFELSDRAASLLVDDLAYGNRDVVPWTTVKALALAGGLSRPDEKADTRALAWRLTGAAGGRRPTDHELEVVADYLRAVAVDHHAVETLREHVTETRLSEFLSPSEISSNRRRVTGLRDVARDL